jgi:hypothetical protein
MPEHRPATHRLWLRQADRFATTHHRHPIDLDELHFPVQRLLGNPFFREKTMGTMIIINVL